MAHNLNLNKESGEYSFYSRKELPWHGLGQFVKEAKDANEALKLAHLDYTVKTGDVFVNFTPKGCRAVPNLQHGYDFVNLDNEIVGKSAKRGSIINGYKCVYRDDTKDVFDIVSTRYEVVQNIESLDVIFGIIKGPDVVDKNEIVIETAGALNKGETIFVTARMPSYIVKVGGKSDPIDKYIVFTSSHDKSGMVTAIVTDIRVVCNNTLNMALRNKNKVSLKHTKNIRERFSSFSTLLGVANKYSAEAKLVLEHIGNIQVNSEIVRNYIYDIFVPDDKREFINAKGGNIEKVSKDDISVKLKNKVNEAMSYIDKGPGQDFARGTAYWMYNGVTSYINNGTSFKDYEDKFQSLIGGSSELLIRKAYDKLRMYV